MTSFLRSTVLFVLAFAPIACRGNDAPSAPSPKTETATAAPAPEAVPAPSAPVAAEPAMTKPAPATAYNKLTPIEERVLVHKGTERAFTGEYTDTDTAGTYVCRRCNAALYKSDSKFHSGCGWPAFDDEVAGAVERILDADGMRIEIVCTNCKGHLGHVFEGERMTQKNVRHCVNSVSLKFVPAGKPLPAPIVLPTGGK